MYIFDDRSTDPLEEKIINILRQGSLSATELSAALSRNIPKDRLQPILQQLESQRRISIVRQKSGGRPRQIISLAENNATNEFNENTK